MNSTLKNFISFLFMSIFYKSKITTYLFWRFYIIAVERKIKEFSLKKSKKKKSKYLGSG